MICNLCPRKCNVDRAEHLGFCKAPESFKVARAMLHFWEEPCISGKNGSGAVFFSGCNMGCVFCQNDEISHGCKGVEISDERLVEIVERLIEQGAENINLVNPSHYAKRLSRVLKAWKSPVPIVYNTSAFDSVEALKMMDGLVDIYLPDFKYIDEEKAKKYSKMPAYPSVAMDALREMKRQVGEDEFDENGMMKKGMIIRHLILPSNTNSSIRVLDYLAENFSDTYISLMAQYVPCGCLDGFDEINRPITKREYDKVVNHLFELGLEKIFLQERSSADKKYIPSFNYEGIIDF